jgi:DNA replication protein DnaC
MVHLWCLSAIPRGASTRVVGEKNTNNGIKLLQKMQFARADGSIIKELSKLEKLNFLILDDWGLQPLDTPAMLSLLQLIEDRHGKNSTIITSQLPVAQSFDYINEPTLADAILDRLMQQVHRIELKGESMRKNKKKNQDSLS